MRARRGGRKAQQFQVRQSVEAKRKKQEVDTPQVDPKTLPEAAQLQLACKRIEKLVECIQYKPGWEIQFSSTWGSPFLNIRASVEAIPGTSGLFGDEVTGPIPLTLGEYLRETELINQFRHGDLDEWVVGKVRNLIMRLEVHEANECLRVNGERAINPHHGQSGDNHPAGAYQRLYSRQPRWNDLQP